MGVVVRASPGKLKSKAIFLNVSGSLQTSFDHGAFLKASRDRPEDVQVCLHMQVFVGVVVRASPGKLKSKAIFLTLQGRCKRLLTMEPS